MIGREPLDRRREQDEPISGPGRSTIRDFHEIAALAKGYAPNPRSGTRGLSRQTAIWRDEFEPNPGTLPLIILNVPGAGPAPGVHPRLKSPPLIPITGVVRSRRGPSNARPPSFVRLVPFVDSLLPPVTTVTRFPRLMPGCGQDVHGVSGRLADVRPAVNTKTTSQPGRARGWPDSAGEARSRRESLRFVVLNDARLDQKPRRESDHASDKRLSTSR